MDEFAGKPSARLPKTGLLESDGIMHLFGTMLGSQTFCLKAVRGMQVFGRAPNREPNNPIGDQ